MGRQWYGPGTPIDRTYSMTVEEAAAVLTGQDSAAPPGADEIAAEPLACHACGGLVMVPDRHGRHHAAVAIVAEALNKLLPSEDT